MSNSDRCTSSIAVRKRKGKGMKTARDIADHAYLEIMEESDSALVIVRIIEQALLEYGDAKLDQALEIAFADSLQLISAKQILELKSTSKTGKAGG